MRSTIQYAIIHTQRYNIINYILTTIEQTTAGMEQSNDDALMMVQTTKTTIERTK